MPSPERERRHADEALRVVHLRREVKTALELAVAALAHAEVMDALATTAGLLEALNEFPSRRRRYLPRYPVPSSWPKAACRRGGSGRPALLGNPRPSEEPSRPLSYGITTARAFPA